MSVESATAVSEVSVLTTVAVKQGMDLVRRYRIDRTVPCRIVPVSSREAATLKMRGMEVSHRIYFGVDPGEITEKERLLKVGKNGRPDTHLRPVGLLVDAHDMGILWSIYADSRTRDNEAVVMVD